MICYPNAKVNLGLNIVSRREDGFHNINSFFLPIPLFDMLEIHACALSSEKIKISYSGIDFEDKQNDLVLQAYNLLDRKFTLPSVKVHLHKNIPSGSGLGGGSSDATFMLMMLNQLFSLRLSKKELLQYSMLLGSDCPFFLTNRFSHVSGLGEHVDPVDYSFKEYYIVIVKPDLHVSTAVVFSHFNFTKNSVMLFDKTPNLWKEKLLNDLESVTFEMFPELKKIKDKLYDLGAVYSSMTGSGSAIYGLFDKQTNLKNKFHQWVWEGALSEFFKK